MHADPDEAGFTLIEVVIALALFALISVAGLALIDSVMRVEEGTKGRLERVGQLQRAMYVVTSDLEQAEGGTLAQVEGGVQFRRQSPSPAEEGAMLTYSQQGDRLLRTVGASTSATRNQELLAGISSARWAFFFRDRGWQDSLPAPGDRKIVVANPSGFAEPGNADAPSPVAIALTVALGGSAASPGRSIRRVVELSASPTNASLR